MGVLVQPSTSAGIDRRHPAGRSRRKVLSTTCSTRCGTCFTLTKQPPRFPVRFNEKKTRLVKLPEERFDFLGYTVGRFYGKDGRPYWGTAPSRKAIKRVMREVHDMTTSRWNAMDPESRIERLNPLLRGWAGYFSQGPVKRAYRLIDTYTARRLRLWLMRRRGKRGTGYRQYSDQYLYEQLGLIRLLPASDRSNAKVC